MPTYAHNDVEAFWRVLAGSRRILAVCGAGLSASSGLPTFRGAGGLWRNRRAQDLATPEAFAADPGLVWLFYAQRRHAALRAQPNPGHRALAALARRRGDDFLCVTQNVDDLAQRAGHPPAQLRTLHGSLFDVRCASANADGRPRCGWIERGNVADPFCPALASAAEDSPLEEQQPVQIPASAIPRCPQCQTGLQRPGVVWFGEWIDPPMLDGIDAWIDADEVDVVLVIGTSAVVHPAASYSEQARGRHTRVVTINLDAEEPENLEDLEPGDFAFGGDAAVLLPQLLEPVIGKMRDDGTFE